MCQSICESREAERGGGLAAGFQKDFLKGLFAFIGFSLYCCKIKHASH